MGVRVGTICSRGRGSGHRCGTDGGSSGVGLTVVASRVDWVNEAVLVKVLRESLEGEGAEAPGGGHGVADDGGEGAGDAAGVDIGFEDGVGAIAESSVDEGGRHGLGVDGDNSREGDNDLKQN